MRCFQCARELDVAKNEALAQPDRGSSPGHCDCSKHGASSITGTPHIATLPLGSFLLTRYAVAVLEKATEGPSARPGRPPGRTDLLFRNSPSRRGSLSDIVCEKSR